MIANILAVFATIREVVALLSGAKKAWDKWNDKKIDKHYEKKTARRDRLAKQISLETDDDKLRILHTKLRNLNSDDK